MEVWVHGDGCEGKGMQRGSRDRDMGIDRERERERSRDIGRDIGRDVGRDIGRTATATVPPQNNTSTSNIR